MLPQLQEPRRRFFCPRTLSDFFLLTPGFLFPAHPVQRRKPRTVKFFRAGTFFIPQSQRTRKQVSRCRSAKRPGGVFSFHTQSPAFCLLRRASSSPRIRFNAAKFTLQSFFRAGTFFHPVKSTYPEAGFTLPQRKHSGGVCSLRSSSPAFCPLRRASSSQRIRFSAANPAL